MRKFKVISNKFYLHKDVSAANDQDIILTHNTCDIMGTVVIEKYKVKHTNNGNYYYIEEFEKPLTKDQVVELVNSMCETELTFDEIYYMGDVVDYVRAEVKETKSSFLNLLMLSLSNEVTTREGEFHITVENGFLEPYIHGDIHDYLNECVRLSVLRSYQITIDDQNTYIIANYNTTENVYN